MVSSDLKRSEQEAVQILIGTYRSLILKKFNLALVSTLAVACHCCKESSWNARKHVLRLAIVSIIQAATGKQLRAFFDWGHMGQASSIT